MNSQPSTIIRCVTAAPRCSRRAKRVTRFDVTIEFLVLVARDADQPIERIVIVRRAKSDTRVSLSAIPDDEHSVRRVLSNEYSLTHTL